MFGSGLKGSAASARYTAPWSAPCSRSPRDLLAAWRLGAGQDPPTGLRIHAEPRRHLLLPISARTTCWQASPSRPLRLRRLERKFPAFGRTGERGRHAVDAPPWSGFSRDPPFALAWLHRRAGLPAGREPARSELLRQLGQGRPSCDCGGGWRWETSGELLVLRYRPSEEERVADFSYTLGIPGEVEIPEIAVRLVLSRRPVEPWMLSGSPRCAALALPLAEGDNVTVRNRRPGDRIHPLGADGSRKLKELLIDRRVPRRDRDRLPLICVGERIAWVPGVTIDHSFRIAGEKTAWIAEIT